MRNNSLNIIIINNFNLSSKTKTLWDSLVKEKVAV